MGLTHIARRFIGRHSTQSSRVQSALKRLGECCEALLEGFGNSWLASVDGLDPDFASSAEVYIAALYWAAATVTTVGFGDISAVTDVERVAGPVCSQSTSVLPLTVCS